MKNAIQVKGLTKRFGRFTAVDRVDMVIPRERVYGFLGPNGSGKTTAIRMMCGLLEPSAGEIEVLGMKIPEQTRQIRREVGYMTQKFSLYSDLTILQNMQFMAQIMGVEKSQRSGRVHHLLDRFHLSSFSNRPAGALSGGQKRRLALAAAVIHHPKLLLLDEPTSEVDPNTRREFWDELFIMCEGGTTVLVTTHLMDEAERCHQLAILHEGQKVADGTPKALKQNLGSRIFQMDGQDITSARHLLVGLPEVLTTTRIGVSLRVMLRPGQREDEAWLAEQVSGCDLSIKTVEPSMEDVFVMVTQETDKGA